MATTQLGRVIHNLRRATLLQDRGGATDGQLLESFIARRDEAAFEALVCRHGPMVLAVCRRILGNVHDAEDAFQAAFIVLARKAASVLPRELVGNWLHGVAYRTALEARAISARRQMRERQVRTMPEPEVVAQEPWHELRPILDQELTRLPTKYRVPVILCELEGRTRKEVARQLAIPEGTLSSRLATARKLLANRLAGRGLALSAGALAGLLAENAASACVPAPLMVSTVQAATLIGAGEGTLLSAKVAALAKGVMQSMLLSKLKIATAVVLAGCLIGTGLGVVTHRVLAGETSAAVVAPSTVESVAVNADADKPKDGEKPRDADKPKEGDKRRDGDKPKDGEKAKDNRGEEVTLTGTISKELTKRKRDDGSEIQVTMYYLTEEKGKPLPIPGPRISEGGKQLDKFNIADYVGKEVTITARALTVKTGEAPNSPKRITRVLVITDIKEKKK